MSNFIKIADLNARGHIVEIFAKKNGIGGLTLFSTSPEKVFSNDDFLTLEKRKLLTWTSEDIEEKIKKIIAPQNPVVELTPSFIQQEDPMRKINDTDHYKNNNSNVPSFIPPREMLENGEQIFQPIGDYYEGITENLANKGNPKKYFSAKVSNKTLAIGTLVIGLLLIAGFILLKAI